MSTPEQPAHRRPAAGTQATGANTTAATDPRVAVHEIDDVVGVAARLAEEEADRRRGASVEELKAVARELNVGEEFVDEALRVREREKEARAEAVRQEAVAAVARQAQVRGLLIRAGAALVGVVLLLFGVALYGSSGLTSAAQAVKAAEAQVEVVVDREVSLAPQLVALAGGDAAALDAARAKVQAAPDMKARIAAAEDLSAAMTAALARAPENAADSQARLNLQYEIVGAQNRVTTELRRLAEARAAYDAASSSFAGGLATTLGLAEAPE